MSREDEEKRISEKTGEKKQEKKQMPQIGKEETIIRIMSTDIPGNKKIMVGLIRIKGVSWSFSNAVCRMLRLDKNRLISSLSREEIEKISSFLKNPELPEFMMNRRRDFETGENKHLLISDLDLQKEFDIKRLKKIRSYRGLRHATGQPTRGQRTKSHFRKAGKKKAVGVMGKSKPGKK